MSYLEAIQTADMEIANLVMEIHGKVLYSFFSKIFENCTLDGTYCAGRWPNSMLNYDLAPQRLDVP